MVPFSVCGDTGSNTVSGESGTSDIPAGKANRIHDGECATVAGGSENWLRGDLAALSGGLANTADGKYAALNGGTNGVAKGMYISHAGGQNNKIWSNYASSAGGFKNTISGRFSVSIGGNNRVQGHHSLAIGTNTQVVSNFGGGFGFGEAQCFVPYKNAIRLCGQSLHLNGEELDMAYFSRRARRLREEQDVVDETKEDVLELEWIVQNLEDRLNAVSTRLQAVLAQRAAVAASL